ncbi:acylphosphatase [Canicola haemoglobinophilus]|nr:acylphosphatase [Canicola haemoglobinophilus]
MMKKQFSVYGRVQGVGFRYFTWREARKIGVLGYVKNMPDGSVYVVAVGKDTQISHFYDYLRLGPKTAKVTEVLVQDYLAEHKFNDFSIKY